MIAERVEGVLFAELMMNCIWARQIGMNNKTK